MKFPTRTILTFLLVVILCSFLVSCSEKKRAGAHSKSKTHTHAKTKAKTHSKTHSKTHMVSKSKMQFYETHARTYVNFAKLAYCEKPVVESLSCSFCNTITSNQYNTFFIHSVMKEHSRHFQFIILYNDDKQEVVITFSGPTTDQGNYFNHLYSGGFVQVPELGGIKIESEYWNVYSHNFRDILHEKVGKIANSNRAHYTFILVGHSLGGSLANLAAYDLVLNNIIYKSQNSPLVYTYGQLRIGDQDFVSRLNNSVKVVRIVKNNDYVTRMPNCLYIHGSYRCYRTQTAAIRSYPALRTYYSGLNTRRIFAGFLKDPIVRGTRYINGRLHYVNPIYTQQIGVPLYYTNNNFNHYSSCNYVNNVPVCERNLQLPSTFSPEVHRQYYDTNVESC
jgi:hypothetical protein